MDVSGSDGTVVPPGAILLEHPLIVNGVARLIANDTQSLSGFSSLGASAAVLYDSHPTAVAANAPAAHHIDATNPVQLMQAQLAAAYGAHDASIQMHGDWSLIAADTHHTVQTAVHDLGHVYADPLAGVEYAHTAFHPFFDHADLFGLADPYHFDSDRFGFGNGLFTHHNLTVDHYF